MAKAVELKIVAVDTNGTYNDLKLAVENILENHGLIQYAKKVNEWEFEFNEDARYNYVDCMYDEAVEALNGGGES